MEDVIQENHMEMKASTTVRKSRDGRIEIMSTREVAPDPLK